MEIYKGVSNSGVLEYEFNKEGIIVRFKDGEKYLYNNERPGKKHVDNMMKLALAGSGLATYINKYVRNNYDRKLE